MSPKNICKFPTPSILNSLGVACFVLEADENIMKIHVPLLHHRLILVTQGSGDFHFDNACLHGEVGYLLFGMQDESFFVDPHDSLAYIYIDYNGARADELLRRFNIRASNRSFEGFEGLVPLWNESLTRANAQTIDLAAESILLYTFSRLGNTLSPTSDLLSSILQITEEEFTDPALTLASLAERLSYNPKYISHTFKEKMGVPYTQYLRSMRIKYAVSLFDHGLDSIKNVAFLSGFSDPLYFSTVFKQEIGASPSEYKKQPGCEE